MKNTVMYGIVFIILLCHGALVAQDEIVDRLSMAFSDPGQIGTVTTHVVNGSISVEGYSGKEVIVEATTTLQKIEPVEEERKVTGLKRIPFTATGLTIEEENNHMEITTSSWKNYIELAIKVPTQCNLNLGCVNGGELTVQNVSGELEVSNTNGKVTLQNISGSVVGHTINETLSVIFNSVQPDKVMSFTSFNGDVDVTLPANVKADVKIKSRQGEIYTDFDIQLAKSARNVLEENEREGEGKYRIRIDDALRGSINGGGPELSFSSVMGDVIIRKKK